MNINLIDTYEESPAFEKIQKSGNRILNRKSQWNMCLKKNRYCKDTAKALVKKIKDERDITLRYYKCLICKKYHLTKNEET